MVDETSRTRVAAGAPSGNGRRRWRPTATAELVGRLLDPSARRAGFVDARLVADWPSIVGPEIASMAVPLRVDRRSRCLTLLVRPAAALLIQHQEPQLLERINAFFGTAALARLSLLQGPLPRVPGTAPAPLPPDPADVARVTEDVARIEPEPLRGALLKLGLAIAARRRQRP
jgi:hypothetical protein